LLWDDYRYKHRNFWSVFYRSVAIFCATIFAPLVYDKIGIIKSYLLIFPLLAGVICCISWWLLRAEHLRIQRAESRFRELMNPAFSEHGLSEFEKFGGIFGLSIGKYLPNIWLASGILISSTALWAVLRAQ
jgi:hypothetical protein